MKRNSIAGVAGIRRDNGTKGKETEGICRSGDRSGIGQGTGDI